jgi:ABC-type multidrug transport system ATPase subunit/signal transduction histidine kinase
LQLRAQALSRKYLATAHGYAEAVLAIRGVSKSFGPRRVIEGVTLSVAAGELVALVGENGAGKSTLVNCVAGLLDPDEGEIEIEGKPLRESRGRLGVVWQDLALCDNLDVTANLFLGHERGRPLLDEGEMNRVASQLLGELGIEIPDFTMPVGYLSGGQRQSIAIARALLSDPRLLVLDEPSAALGLTETATLERLLRRLRNRGVALLLVSHRVDQVFSLADRIAVLRRGRLVADVATRDVRPEDIIGFVSGAETDSVARKQLRQLRSLADQLAEVEPSASLPLIVSALSNSLGVERVCVHLVDDSEGSDGVPMLVRRAAVGLHPDLFDALDRLPLGPGGSVAGEAAASARVATIEDTHGDRLLGTAADVLSAWAVPIVGAQGVLGVISSYLASYGAPSAEQLELALLHANLAAVTIERNRLLGEVTRRNRILESLRAMLESLAGPAQVRGGFGMALVPLCRGLGARHVALFEYSDDGPVFLAGADIALAERETEPWRMLELGAQVIFSRPRGVSRATLVGQAVVGVPVLTGDRPLALVAWWDDLEALRDDALDLLDDAARSLGLAVEREAIEAAHQESYTLRRSNEIQRDFLHRLSHELRTPLTAIHGYADTLRQTDVSWDAVAQDRFLERIVSESARMNRLVRDLLDNSAIEHGGLGLQRDWSDLGLLIAEAVSCVGIDPASITVDMGADPVAIWADHDRIEQVFVNLLNNAQRHGTLPISIRVESRLERPPCVAIHFVDSGQGFTPELSMRAFEPYARGGHAPGAGLGLAIARGIVEAHGGSLEIDRVTAGCALVVNLPVDPAEVLAS